MGGYVRNCNHLVNYVRCYTSELQAKPPFDVCTLTVLAILLRRNKKNHFLALSNALNNKSMIITSTFFFVLFCLVLFFRNFCHLNYSLGLSLHSVRVHPK